MWVFNSAIIQWCIQGARGWGLQVVDDRNWFYCVFEKLRGVWLKSCFLLYDSIKSYSIGVVLIFGSRLTWQCCLLMPIYGDAALLSLPCFLTSPYMDRARDHVTAARSRDLSSPIYRHVEALTGYTWPRYLISLGPDTSMCNRCNVCPHTQASAMWALPLCTALGHWISTILFWRILPQIPCNPMFLRTLNTMKKSGK